MRKSLFFGLAIAAPLLFASSSASAWGCGGYGYSAPRYYGYSAPRVYGYRYYAPRRLYGARVFGYRSGWGVRRWGWGGWRRW
jgi:hypothetical protein